jgi:histone-lysine N-methyltransferase SETMAR
MCSSLKLAMSKEMYINILRRLRDAVRRKRCEKWRNNSWFLCDNASAHRSVLVNDFLAKNNVTTLEHPPYSPDLAPADLYLFHRLKSTLTGRRFCDVTGIMKNATED